VRLSGARGQALSGNGTSLSCITPNGSYTETDPTVTAFAKAALPSCTGGNVLTGNGTNLSCVSGMAGFSETDPLTKAFAKANLPNCTGNTVLTGNGTSLSCVSGTAGFTETDPTVKAFAKANLPTCGGGQALKGDGTSMSCVNVSGAGVESDPKVGATGNGYVCYGNGSAVSCADGSFAYNGDLTLPGNLLLNGSNMWMLHTPDDGRTSLYFGRGSNGSVSEWPIEFKAGGSAYFGGSLQSNSTIISNGTIVNGSNDPYFTTNANNKHIVLSGGSGWADTGAVVVLRGQSDGYNAHGIEMFAGNAERVRVLANGNVGIGTPSPDHPLTVRGPDNIASFVSTGGNAYIRLSVNSDLNQRLELANRGGRTALWNPNTGDAFNVIHASGSVGIGTTSPNANARLQVMGRGTGQDGWLQYISTGDWQGIHVDNSNEASNTVGILKNNDGSFHIHRWNVGDILYSNSDRSQTVVGGNNVVVSGATIASNGDIWMGWINNWLSAYLNQVVTAGSQPNFWNIYVGYLGWLSDKLNQDVRWGSWPTFNGFTDSSDASYQSDPSGSNILSYVEIKNGGEPTLAFHRPGIFATHVKLRGDNRIWFGGWSAGDGEIGLQAESLHTQGGAQFNRDGNIYMPWLGNWMSNLLNQSVVVNSQPQFGRVYDDDRNYYIDLNTTSVMNTVYAWTYYHNSDERLKKNIQTIGNGLDIVKKLRGVTFDWKKDDSHSAGVIAQEVQKVMPYAVKSSKEGKDAMFSVEYDQLVGPMIEAIKEQQKQIEALEKKVEVLEAGHRE
jgi:hypothetical protein